MAHIINTKPDGRTKTVLEQLWEQMDRPEGDPSHISAKVENGTLQLIETSPGVYKDLGTGDTAHVTVHNTMSICLTFCRPVASTLAVVQADRPKTDIKAEAEQRQSACEIINQAVTHLRCHDAGQHALYALHTLFNGPALDERSHKAVRDLVEQFYTGPRSGTALGAVRDALDSVNAKRNRSIYEGGRGAGKDFSGHGHN